MPLEIRNPKPRPPRIVVYGPPGIGKTTFAAGMPSPILLPIEDGADGVDVPQIRQPGSWVDIVDTARALMDESHAYKTLVIDSATAAQELLFCHVCAEERVSSIELACGGYGKGYTRAAEHWRSLLARLDALRTVRRMIIVIIAHSAVVSHADPRVEPYDRLTPRLHTTGKGSGIGAMTTEWADVVGCAAYDIYVDAERGKSSGERVLYLQDRPAFLAKNRYKLPDSVPLDAANLIAQIRANMHQTTKGDESPAENKETA